MLIGYVIYGLAQYIDAAEHVIPKKYCGILPNASIRVINS